MRASYDGRERSTSDECAWFVDQTRMLSRIRKHVERVCTTPHCTISYEEGYRMFYIFTCAHPTVESRDLVLTRIPDWIAQQCRDWIYSIDVIIRLVYDIMLYPCRVHKISLEQFRACVRSRLLSIVSDNIARYICRRQYLE